MNKSISIAIVTNISRITIIVIDIIIAAVATKNITIAVRIVIFMVIAVAMLIVLDVVRICVNTINIFIAITPRRWPYR